MGRTGSLWKEKLLFGLGIAIPMAAITVTDWYAMANALFIRRICATVCAKTVFTVIIVSTGNLSIVLEYTATVTMAIIIEGWIGTTSPHIQGVLMDVDRIRLFPLKPFHRMLLVNWLKSWKKASFAVTCFRICLFANWRSLHSTKAINFRCVSFVSW